MRILQIMAGAERGGAETAFVDMCLAFNDHGIDQHLITRSNDLRVPQLKAAGLVVTTLPLGGLIDMYSPYKIQRVIDQFKPQIVQTWMARAAWKTPCSGVNSFFGETVRRIASRRCDAQESQPNKSHLNVARLGGYYDLKYFKSSDYFITITPMIKDYLVNNGVASDNIRHINNFAETEIAITPINRADLNTPDDAFVCLALSRYHPAKALDTLIKSIVPLPNVYLWLAGEGHDRVMLETLAEDLNVASRVKFLGWRSDRAALLNAADVCVFPSRHEPFGTVFVQAWAQRTPVICSTADGPRQFVKHEQDGLLFEIDNVNALTQSIQRVMNDKTLCADMIQDGYDRYQSEFTRDICVQNYLNFYDEILRRQKII
jgi:glycosyltransferase involved in cell wall biosynthesis